MSNLKAFALVVVGILVFTGACVYAGDTYNKEGTGAAAQQDLQSKATALLDRLRICQLIVANNSGAGELDPQKVMNVQANQFANRIDLAGLEFQLEIIDVSGDPQFYSRSIATGNPIQTTTPPSVVEEGQLITMHSAAGIKVGPDEVHPARFILRVWEG